MPATALFVRRKPLIYTDVLFAFVLWRFSIKFPKIHFKPSALGPLQSVHLREPLLWYFKRVKPLQTSPHVIAEMHGWAMSRSKAGLRRPALGYFWRLAQEELTRLGLEEGLIRVTDMELETLRSFGPIETAILTLAKRQGTVVLTEDGRLRGECAHQEISVLSCSDVLAEWQENQV